MSEQTATITIERAITYLVLRAKRKPYDLPDMQKQVYDLAIDALGRVERLETINAALLAACKETREAIDPFVADQSYAKDSRCGLVQPVSVEDCNELGRVYNLLGLLISEQPQPESEK